MHGRLRLMVLAGLAALAAALTVGVAAAGAHGGPGGPRGPGGYGPGFGGATASTLVTQAAKELGVTRSKLVTAIHDAADTRIAAAVDDGDITSEQAEYIKAEADDNLRAACGL